MSITWFPVSATAVAFATVHLHAPCAEDPMLPLLPSNQHTISAVPVVKLQAEPREATLARRRAAIARMVAAREKAIRDGMVLMSEDEILQEVARRRGEVEE